MYEMEGPRAASLLRLADHSADERCSAGHRIRKLSRTRRSPDASEVRSCPRLGFLSQWQSNFYWFNHRYARGIWQLLRLILIINMMSTERRMLSPAAAISSTTRPHIDAQVVGRRRPLPAGVLLVITTARPAQVRRGES